MRFRNLWPVVGLVCLTAMAAQVSYPVFEKDKLPIGEVAGHRAAVKGSLPANAVSVLFTNSEHVRNNDVDFRFRPDSDFLYLSGFEEPEAALILAPSGIVVDGKRTTEVLFVNERDYQSETWTGYRMGSKDAAPLLGIETVLPNSRFAEVLNSIKDVSVSTHPLPEGRRGKLGAMVSAYEAWLTGKTVAGSVARKVGDLRVIKSKEETRLIQRAVDASVVGHAEAMRSCEPGMTEYQIQAIHEYCYRRLGCEYEAYPCIVGNGPNSTILHYESDRGPLVAGDLLLMDCAGEYHGYAADVTRTIPVSGKFSTEQRAIYNVVLAAQDAGIAALKPGVSFRASHLAATKVIQEGLLKLKIIQKPSEVSRYFVHGTSHTVGLDVHDSPTGLVTPGVVMTVEPGIYIKAGSPCDKKWWNIGIRIEDDILITERGPVNMSGALPRDPDGIERLMRGRGLGNTKIRGPRE